VRVFLHNLMRELAGEAGSVQDINDLTRFTTTEHDVARFTRLLGKSTEYATPSEVAQVRPDIQASLAAAQSGLAITKTHLFNGIDCGHPTINDEVTRAAIYLVRNPLDVAISYAHHSGESVDAVIDAMNTWDYRIPSSPNGVSQMLGTWSQHAKSWCTGTPFPICVVRYEDLLHDPARAFGRIAGFLGLRPGMSMLTTAIGNSEFRALAQQERENGFVERPPSSHRFFREGRAGQWKTLLSPEQTKSLVRAHGSVMAKMGYGVSNIAAPTQQKGMGR